MFIIFPMAGKSERFKQKGYPTDKYRLPLGGLTVFEHAVISFKAYFEEYIFLFIHSDKNNTKNFIQEKCQSMGLKKTRVISLNENTRGQADTVYKGLELGKVSQTEAMTIFNIDTFRPNFIFPKDLDLKKTDGYLEVFEGTGSNWSYVRPQIGSNRLVAETAEKKIISNLCCTGLYYFREVNLFKNAFEKYTKDESVEEYYVAPLYNYLISDGLSIHYHEIPQNEIFFSGTPEEYKNILKVWGE